MFPHLIENFILQGCVFGIVERAGSDPANMAILTEQYDVRMAGVSSAQSLLPEFFLSI